MEILNYNLILTTTINKKESKNLNNLAASFYEDNYDFDISNSTVKYTGKKIEPNKCRLTCTVSLDFYFDTFWNYYEYISFILFYLPILKYKSYKIDVEVKCFKTC